MASDGRRLGRFVRREPEISPSVWSAVVAMRVELLLVATGYAVWAALEAEDLVALSDVRDWLRWVERFADRLGAGQRDLDRDVSESDQGGAVHRWVSEYREILDRYELSDAAFDSSLAGIWGDAWSEQRERLADRARSVEELHGKPLGEIEGQENGAGVALLGAVEDSLTLLLSDDELVSPMRWGSEDIYHRLVAAQEQGIWDVIVDDLPTEVAEDRVRPFDPNDERIAVRGKKLSDQITNTTFAAGKFYLDLAPDGRVLTEEERSDVRASLKANALCLRDAAVEHDLLAFAAVRQNADLRPLVEFLRMTQRSLVLALSDDRNRRERAISIESLSARFRPVYQNLADLWDWPSWEDLRS